MANRKLTTKATRQCKKCGASGDGTVLNGRNHCSACTAAYKASRKRMATKPYFSEHGIKIESVLETVEVNERDY